MRTLTLGDRGKEVSDVQKRLHALGYELGNEGLDGFLGPAQPARPAGVPAGARSARRRHPRAQHLARAGRGRLRASATVCSTCACPTFRGDDVLALQVKLNLLGFNAGPERGIFDTAVERALIDFQRNAGLPSDGIVGDDTLRKLDALRKAESGREGKKIPDRDEGFVAATSLAGTVVAIDPGHGGQDAGVVSPSGRKEKDLTLAVGLRLAELLRAEGSRVVMTRETDQTVPLYVRTDAAETAAADYLVSLHFNGNSSPAAAGAVSYFFQRSHYYSEHGARLADYIGAEVGRLSSGPGSSAAWDATSPCCASRPASP